MLQITFDNAYLTDVFVTKEWSMFQDKETLTPEEFLKVLRGEDKCTMTSSIDHPEFTKLRESLGEQGYIEIQRGWWNGDRVLKPFKLNGFLFKKGQKFPCAAALKNSIICAKKFGYKTLV